MCYDLLFSTRLDFDNTHFLKIVEGLFKTSNKLLKKTHEYKTLATDYSCHLKI